MDDKHYSENGLKILITIVNRDKADFYADLLQSFEVNLQLIALGKGAATPEMISMLDFIDAEKAVIFSVIREDRVPHALRALEEKFKTIRKGHGIAFTVPLSSVIGVSVFGFLSNNEKTVKENR